MTPGFPLSSPLLRENSNLVSLFTFTMGLRLTGNFRKLVESLILDRNFVDCPLVPPKDTTPPNSAEKTFMNSHKTSKFAPSKFSLPVHNTFIFD